MGKKRVTQVHSDKMKSNVPPPKKKKKKNKKGKCTDFCAGKTLLGEIKHQILQDIAIWDETPNDARIKKKPLSDEHCTTSSPVTHSPPPKKKSTCSMCCKTLWYKKLSDEMKRLGPKCCRAVQLTEALIWPSYLEIPWRSGNKFVAWVIWLMTGTSQEKRPQPPIGLIIWNGRKLYTKFKPIKFEIEQNGIQIKTQQNLNGRE